MEFLKHFSEIAPHLKNPLILSGFAILLFFALSMAIIRSGLIPPLKSKSGNRILNKLLFYGLIVAVMVIVFGFSYAFYLEKNRHKETMAAVDSVVRDYNANQKESDKDHGKLQALENEKIKIDRDIKNLTEAVEAISAEIGKSGLESNKIYQEFKRIRHHPKVAANIAKIMMNRKEVEAGLATNEMDARLAQKEASTWALYFGVLASVYDGTKAEEAYRKAIEMSPGNTEAWLHLGELQFSENKIVEAVEVFEKVVEVAGNNGRVDLKAIALNYLGSINFMRDEITAARKYFEKALTCFEAIGFRKEKASVLHNLGLTYTEIGDYDKAVPSFMEAMGINSQLENIEALANNHRALGALYGTKGDWVLAKLEFEKSRELNRKTGNKLGEAYDLTNLGVISRRQCNALNALALHKKSFRIFENLDDKFGLGCVNENLGTAYRDLGEIQKAREHYLTAINLFLELGEIKKLNETQNWLLKLDDPTARECVK